MIDRSHDLPLAQQAEVLGISRDSIYYAAAAGWINALLARRRTGIVKVAIANRLARFAWAVLQGN